MRTPLPRSRSGVTLRALVAASALVVAPAAFSATVTIQDNADRSHPITINTYTTDNNTGVTTVTSTTAPTYYGASAFVHTTTAAEAAARVSLFNSQGPTFIDLVTQPAPGRVVFPDIVTQLGAVGFNASNFTVGGDANTTTRVVTYVPRNADSPVAGGSFAIAAQANRDVQTTPGGIGVTTFSAYSALAQATGRYDLFDKKNNEADNRYYAPEGYGKFGTYTDRSTTSLKLGYIIDATDYSGEGNLRWTGADTVAVIAGNNTYTGDTFIAGTAIVQSNIGQGTLELTATAEVVFNTAQSVQTIANAISGKGKLVFQGDTRLGGGGQSTALTYDRYRIEDVK